MYNHLHEIDINPETNHKLAEIIASIETNGWMGLPLLVDGYNLLNGCHRATACEILDIKPEVHELEIACTWGDDDYTDYLLENLANAGGTDDIYRALEALHEEGLVDETSFAIMRAEYEKE